MTLKEMTDLIEKAKGLGVDVSAIIHDLMAHISATKDQGFSYNRNLSNEFLAGITHYVKAYQLKKLIIGNIDTDSPGGLSVWINADGIIAQECPTCKEIKIVNIDYIDCYLYEPKQIVRSLIGEIVRAYEDKRKRVEAFCSDIDEFNW